MFELVIADKTSDDLVTLIFPESGLAQDAMDALSKGASLEWMDIYIIDVANDCIITHISIAEL